MRAHRSLAALVVAVAALSLLASCGGGGSGNAGQGNSLLVNLLTSSIPTGTTGVLYEVQFEAHFPNPPGVFMVTGGALPLGLSLDRQTGLLSGYPRQVGAFAFQIAARDGSDPTLPPGRDANFAEDRQSFSVNILRGPPHILPQIVPSAQYRASFSYFIDVAGGTTPYGFALTGGSLPAGITLNPATGELCCFPTAVNPALGNPPFPFQVTVTDSNVPVPLTSSGDLSIQVVVLPLGILTASPMTPAAQGFPYDQVFLLSSAGAGDPYTWSQYFPLDVGEIDLADINMTITPTGHLKNAAPPGPTGLGTYKFTALVEDEAHQKVTRAYSILISLGPVLTSITPNRSTQPGPYQVVGINFQPGATVIFKPGATQTVPSSVTFQNSTLLTFPTAPAPPGGVGGAVTVRVLNPDGGFSDKAGGFIFPALSLTFNTTPIFPATQSALSSTGLDVGDVNHDGFADIVHCGTNSGNWGYPGATGSAAGVDLLINAPVGGIFTTPNPPFTKVQLATSGDWHQVKFADFNTDGWLDAIAVGDVGGQRVTRTWLSVAGTFNPGVFQVSVLPYQGATDGVATGHVGDIALGKINTDAVPDLAYVYQDRYQYVSSYTSYGYGSRTIHGGSVATVAGQPNGAVSAGNFDLSTAQSNSLPRITTAGGVALGKFDADGRADVVATDGSASMGVYWWTGGPTTTLGCFNVTTTSSTFGAWSPLDHPAGGVTGCELLGVASGDFTGDGKDDIALPTGVDETGFVGSTQHLITFGGNGTGTFTELPALSPTNRLRYVTMIDGDFDLAQDLAITGGTAGAFNKIEIYKGRGGSQSPLLRQTLTVTGGSPNIGRVAAGDFNNDGRPDVCAAMSFFADQMMNRYNGTSSVSPRGDGSTKGVVIFLNTSN